MHKGPFTESSKPSFIYYPSVGCLEYFSFYIIIITFYLFWISVLGILQKLCYTCPHPSLFTWPSLTRCLDSLYSFTLLSYLQDLFSIFPLSLLILLPTLKKEKRKRSKQKKTFQAAMIKSPICICAYTFCLPFCYFEWTACVFTEGHFFHLYTCSNTLLQEFLSWTL